MKQSTRRMMVAQKRIHQNKDVLRRPRTFHKQEVWFWHWCLNTPKGHIAWVWHVEKLLWNVALIGPLPGKRRLTKPLVVDVTWDGEWVVSEPTWLLRGAGPTIHKAVACFHKNITHYRDILNEPEDDPNINDCIYDQVRDYLNEMIEDTQNGLN